MTSTLPPTSLPVGTQTTFLDLARVILGRPDLTDEHADHLLWEHTPFPMLTANGLVPYLRRINLNDCCEVESAGPAIAPAREHCEHSVTSPDGAGEATCCVCDGSPCDGVTVEQALAHLDAARRVWSGERDYYTAELIARGWTPPEPF